MGLLQNLKRQTQQQIISQPKAFWILSSMEAFEAFSFYGLTSLLILFMSRKLRFLEADSIAIFALFMVMCELLSLIGGYLADRIFGMFPCLMMGSFLMLIGYALAPLLPDLWFLLSLGFIVIGNALFSSNTTSLLGLFYEKGKESVRESGFTLYYASLNVGAFFSLILCGVLADRYGWKYGFVTAALGILPVVALACKYKSLLAAKDTRPAPSITIKKLTYYLIWLSPFLIGAGLYYYGFVSKLMPVVLVGCLAYLTKQVSGCTKEERQRIGQICFLVVLLTIFFSIAEQVRSSLVIFATRHAKTTLLGWQIPSSSLTAMNPIIIILISPLLSLYTSSLSYEKALTKMLYGFTLLFLIFAYLQGIIYYSSISLYATSITLSSLFIVIGGIAISELLVGPLVYSMCAKLSPTHLKASMMGVVTLGYAGANHIAGYLAGLMVPAENLSLTASFEVFRSGFMNILMILGGAILLILVRIKAKNKHF